MSFQFKIPSMACSACAETITKAVNAIDANAKVNADLQTKLVNIETKENQDKVKEAITAVGYPIA